MIQVYDNEILDWCESNAPVSLKNETRENKAVQLINCYVNAHKICKHHLSADEIAESKIFREQSCCKGVPVEFIMYPGDYFQMNDGSWRLIVKDTIEYEVYKSFLNKTKEE